MKFLDISTFRIRHQEVIHGPAPAPACTAANHLKISGLASLEPESPLVIVDSTYSPLLL